MILALTVAVGCGPRWVFAPAARSAPKALAASEPPPVVREPSWTRDEPPGPTREIGPGPTFAAEPIPTRPGPAMVRLPGVSGVVPAGVFWNSAPGAPAACGGLADETARQEPFGLNPGGFGAPSRGSSFSERLSVRGANLWRETCRDVRGDYRNFYTWPVACDLLYSVAGASLLANTSLDHDFRDWYQDDVRSRDTNRFSSFWKTFGEGEIFIPAWAGLGLAGKMLEDVPVYGTVGEFGMRTTRGYLVGVPPMLFMQYGLGGSRPGETSHESMWRPFEDNNAVSGHAFIGAVPFITAARMCDRALPRAGLYILSALPAWSRVNDDSHYLSQACLGWWLAYVACRGVDQTEAGDGCVSFVPIAEPDTLGAMLIWRR